MRASISKAEIVLYAGAAAEDHFSYGYEVDPRLVASSRDDRKSLRLELALVGWERPDYDLDALSRARRFVDARWGAVLAISNALIERFELSGVRGELGGEEVAGLISNARSTRNWQRRDHMLRRAWRERAERARRKETESPGRGRSGALLGVGRAAGTGRSLLAVRSRFPGLEAPWLARCSHRRPRAKKPPVLGSSRRSGRIP